MAWPDEEGLSEVAQVGLDRAEGRVHVAGQIGHVERGAQVLGKSQLPSFAASLRTVLDTLTAEAGQALDASPAAATDQASTAEQPTGDVLAAER